MFIKCEQNYNLNKINGMVGQKSGVRGERTEAGGQGSGIKEQGLRVKNGEQ